MLRPSKLGGAEAFAIGAGGPSGGPFEQAPEEGRVLVADLPVERWRDRYGQVSQSAKGGELTGDEAEELKRLRAEVKQLRREREILIKAAASFRGSHYAGYAYQGLLREHGLTPSMSRKGNCWDTASVERFFGSLQRERADLLLFATRDEARACVVDYIEMFYNGRRLHSHLDDVSPAEFEAKANAA